MRIADVLFHRPAWTDDQTRVVLAPNGDLKARKRGGGKQCNSPVLVKAATCCCDPSSKSVYRCLVNASREVETEL